MYKDTGSITRCPGSGHLSKIMKILVEEQMQRDDETTAYQLHHMLLENRIEISFRTVFCCRTALGWTFHGSVYCQLIRKANKTKRLEWY